MTLSAGDGRLVARRKGGRVHFAPFFSSLPQSDGGKFYRGKTEESFLRPAAAASDFQIRNCVACRAGLCSFHSGKAPALPGEPTRLIMEKASAKARGMRVPGCRLFQRVFDDGRFFRLPFREEP